MKDYKSSRKFRKGLKRLDKKTRVCLVKMLFIFEENEFDPRLNNHKLQGKYSNCRSIDITSDIRMIYEKISKNIYYILDIGSHSELYS